MGYDVFISYSHSADDELAAALQSGPERFEEPWYRPRPFLSCIGGARGCLYSAGRHTGRHGTLVSTLKDPSYGVDSIAFSPGAARVSSPRAQTSKAGSGIPAAPWLPRLRVPLIVSTRRNLIRAVCASSRWIAYCDRKQRGDSQDMEGMFTAGTHRRGQLMSREPKIHRERVH